MNEEMYRPEDLEFATPEEIEEFEEAKVELVGALIEASESRISVLNVEQCIKMLRAEKILRAEAEGKNFNVTSVYNQPYPSMGYISLIGKEINFSDSESFLKVIELANNLDVYPMSNGNVKMEFTFHNLTKKIEGVQ